MNPNSIPVGGQLPISGTPNRSLPVSRPQGQPDNPNALPIGGVGLPVSGKGTVTPKGSPKGKGKVLPIAGAPHQLFSPSRGRPAGLVEFGRIDVDSRRAGLSSDNPGNLDPTGSPQPHISTYNHEQHKLYESPFIRRLRANAADKYVSEGKLNIASSPPSALKHPVVPKISGGATINTARKQLMMDGGGGLGAKNSISGTMEGQHNMAQPVPGGIPAAATGGAAAVAGHAMGAAGAAAV